ncbi:unnamed protein product [Closterium sp. NIES-53]
MTGTDSRGAHGDMARDREAGEQGGVAGGGVGTHQPINPTLPTSTTPSPTTVDPVKAFSIEKFMGEDYEHWSFRMRLILDYIWARILQEDLQHRGMERAENGAGYGVGGGKSGFKKKWKGKDNFKEDNGGGQGEVYLYCKKRRHRWKKCSQRPKDWTPPSSSNQHGGKRSGGVMRASGEEKDEEKGGKSEERKARFFFFVNEGATDPAIAVKVLLHPLTHLVIDSGSSWHRTPRADLLDEIQTAPISTVTSATGAKAKVMGMGCAKFMGVDGELVGLKNVLWMPDLCANLISTGRLGDAGVNTETIGLERYRAYNDECLIWDLQRKGDVHKRMWQIPVLPWRKSGKAAAAASMEEIVTEEDQKAKAPLEVVHMDLVGPMRTEGTGGVVYFLTMMDEWSRFTWACPLSKKSDAAAAIKEEWLPMVERQPMRLVKVLRSDRGGEFLGADCTNFLKRNGIRHQLTCPGAPQQNGIPKRANRTIGEAATGAAGMPYKFWPDAVRHVITVKNRVLT